MDCITVILTDKVINSEQKKLVKTSNLLILNSFLIINGDPNNIKYATICTNVTNLSSMILLTKYLLGIS